MSRAYLIASSALLAVLAASAPYCLTIVPLPTKSSAVANLSNPAYDIVPLRAPAASGMVLHALARIFGNGMAGPLLTRMLLNDNQLWRLRELSLQVLEHVVHQPMPFQRLSSAQHMRHAQLAAERESASANSPRTRDAVGSQRATPPLRWSSREYHAAFASGATTPSAVARALLRALPQIEESVGTVFTEMQSAVVLRQAAASDARWAAGAPLSVWDGVPIGVKEMIDIEGHITGFGSWRGSAEAPSRAAALRDDPMVAKMRAAGAIIVGQTSMTEYGVTPLGWSAHAQGPRNPHDLGRYPGGSSSGAAVAVATGLVPMAIGFDGGGSIRIPAALSGVVGLAAGFGRIAFRTDRESSMTHGGPLAATVADAALSYLLLAQPTPPSGSGDADAETHTTSHGYGGDGPPTPHLHVHWSEWDGCSELGGVRIGVFREHFTDATPEVVAAADAALARLVAKGATIVPIAIPNLLALSLAHGITIAAEFSWAHDREATDGWPLEPSTRVQLAIGRAVTAVEVIAANRLRSWGMAHVAALIRDQQLDAIATPTASRTAPPLSAAAALSGESDTALIVGLIKHIFLGNLLGLPAITVPIGLGNDTRLPVGMQFLGGWWEEARLLRLACALEREMPELPRPPTFFDELDELLGGGGRGGARGRA